ncbi:MAG: molybdopterin molybdotransferase MoeA [Desulfatiglans sp.]|jgi:molybdopterin molybdotransferase|nr:molybdopterin molybdotransferase MoeA [Desulfatiglans sp.]
MTNNINFEIGLNEALNLTLENLDHLDSESVDLTEAVGRVTSSDIYSLVDSPSVAASLKDGYAVVASDISHASILEPVILKLAGYRAAGSMENVHVTAGHAVRVMTGAAIPPGADAVVSEEFTKDEGEAVSVFNYAEKGRNILDRGTDVYKGQCVAKKGMPLSPTDIGQIAAGGHGKVSLVRNPVVAVVSTGDEVIAPGHPMSEGKVYASNMATLVAWCRRYGMMTHSIVVKDDAEEISAALESLYNIADVIITSGGAWTGDRDMVHKILGQLGWKFIFNRIRMGPGKAVGLGMRENKPAFVLPGGPPSNLTGFLQVTLPGLMKMAGYLNPGLPRRMVRLASDIRLRSIDWTQFIFGTLQANDGELIFHPLENESRLQSMAMAQCVVKVPEGIDFYNADTLVMAQIL